MSFIQVGNNINGQSSSDKYGNAVAISKDGTVIATGGYLGTDSNGNKKGYVRLYKNNGGNWSQIGSDIYGENIDDRFGYNVSLSDDGSIVAINAPKNIGDGRRGGHVRVFKNNSGNWSQIGSDIDGHIMNDHGGAVHKTSISLSGDGTHVAIGHPFNNYWTLDNRYRGEVRIYKNENDGSKKFKT